MDQRRTSCSGGDGNDLLQGDHGDDKLNGGIGDDKIEGGYGVDMLWGRAGADDFIYKSELDSGDAPATRDQILDFQMMDRINFSSITYGFFEDPPFVFIGTQTFFAPGQVRYVIAGSDTIVEMNVAGVAGAELTILLSGAFTLTAAQFLL